MNQSKSHKTFIPINFGCRVNSAETNLWSQLLIDQGYQSTTSNPDIILVNTCSVTKKGELESLGKIRSLSILYPTAKIIATGCADLSKIRNIPNLVIYDNQKKEKLLDKLNSSYTPVIKDKFSHTHRYLLKIQSGCTQFCSYCTVPFKRNQLWSLPINYAVSTINKAVKNGYKEIIITGVNIDQYQYKMSSLVSSLLKNTSIPLISFGSVPINSIDKEFINLYKLHPYRLSHFLHIPIQSGSDKILKSMNRPYNSKIILKTFSKLKEVNSLAFGTDIIVGFPNETDQDFLDTIKLCQKIGFNKIHTFRFSPRPDTNAKILHQNSPKFSKDTLKSRSLQIRQLCK
jgi:threonylcarbamoyladenosine tRNA methylthiotransferase MtaB